MDGTTILIDTPPELRLQLVDAGTKRLDAVLFSHAHADHVGGIDDLRIFSLTRREKLPAYGPPEAIDYLRQTYTYIFDAGRVPEPGTSAPRIELTALRENTPATVCGVEILPISLDHGESRVYAYRVGPLAYVTDAKRVPLEAREQLRGVEVLVLNALWWREHPKHLSIPEAIETAQAIGARRTILTHLSHETAHRDLQAELPYGIEPGHDGMVVNLLCP